jgi:hypothetical protein
MRSSRNSTFPDLQFLRQGGPRNFAVALDHPGVGRHHLVEQQVGFVGAQHGAGRRRQVDSDALAIDLDQAHDGGDVVSQVLVVGLVGEVAGDVVGGGDRDRPQQQQRRQHPVEDFAEQGVRVFETDEGVAGGFGFAELLTQRHRPLPPVFPGNSRGRERW